MKKTLFGLLFLASLSQAEAKDVQTTLTIIINSPASTSITCNPVSPWTISGSTISYPSTSPIPVPANSAICNLTIAPSGWSGAMSLTQTGNNFAVSGPPWVLSIGQSALGAGTYTITLSATP